MAAIGVRSVTARRFWDLLHSLPPNIQDLAHKNYDLWRENPAHPSLHFRRLKGSEDRYMIRVGDHYRALGLLSPDTVIWVRIGTHEEYNELLR
jgi:hypothetical protein